jgi:phosphoribosylanthranilate isomerase
MRTRVKICGITRPEDAVAAAEQGVDAIGLVFYPKSPRNIDVDRANEILSVLPPFVTSVALFLDARTDFVSQILQSVPIDVIQFHGDECPADCGTFGRPYIKAIGMKGGVNVQAYADTYPDARGFLLDSHAVGEAGGTGTRFDWAETPSLNKPVILAGGLNPGNVAEAIRLARPYALDISSGVESAPGIKDRDMMKAFMTEVRNADEY